MINNTNINKRIIAYFLLPVLVLMAGLTVVTPSSDVYASKATLEELTIEVNGNALETATDCVELSYPNNRYINMYDMAVALMDTDACFDFEIGKENIDFVRGKSITLRETDEEDEGEKDDEEKSYIRQISCNGKFNDLKIDGEDAMYYTIVSDTNDNGTKDCFIAPYDLAMILDIDIQIMDDSRIVIDTGRKFNVNPENLEADGYFQGVNAIAIGNASTGEIYYEYQASTPYAIASTTKLMTYLVLREAMDQKGGSLQDKVTISEEVEALSNSDDGVLPMKAGNSISVEELMYGMLLPSSNECALALAEYAYGNEDVFVEKMNTKASDLGLSSARFNNCNGLPKYNESTVAAKMQNTLSAEDMFKMCSYILSVYPEIKEITSTRKIELEAFRQEIKNTNPVLANMSECTGLKTGTTNKAGACLVTSLEVNTSAGKEDLLVVVLGAENSVERCRVAQILSNYALDVRNGDASALYSGSAGFDNEIPTSAEGFVSLITRAARNKTLAAN